MPTFFFVRPIERAAAVAGAHARGVRLRGLLVGEADLIVITVESRVELERDAPSVAVESGPERSATVALRGDAAVRRNGRRTVPGRLRVGDRVQVRAGAVTALDPWHGQGRRTIFPRVCRRSSSR
jgi:hypothetical protein